MKTIRQVNDYKLNYEPLQGLCNVSKDEQLSLWFGADTKDELMALTDEQFIKEVLTFQID